MKLTRGTALVALMLVALAAPVTAYALSDDGNADQPAGAVAQEKAKPDKPGKPKHDKGADRADEASAAGRAHAEAMRAWARCVAEAAKADDAPTPPKLACGDKPVGPGRAKHLAANGGAAPGRSGGHKPKAPGRSASPQD